MKVRENILKKTIAWILAGALNGQISSLQNELNALK